MAVNCVCATQNYQSDGNRTPLMKASKGGYLQIVQYLIQHGAIVSCMGLEWNSRVYGNRRRARARVRTT